MEASQRSAVVRFCYEAGQLKLLPRAGWLLPGIQTPESVAGHSFRVGVIACLIAVSENANPDRAATLGLFHDFPEARIGDVPSIGKPYTITSPADYVINDQVDGMPATLADHIRGLVAEHESSKGPDASLEALCSRDADKLECFLQAREYQEHGNPMMEPWLDTMASAVTTHTGRMLVEAAYGVSPKAWWLEFAEKFGRMPRRLPAND